MILSRVTRKQRDYAKNPIFSNTFAVVVVVIVFFLSEIYFRADSGAKT